MTTLVGNKLQELTCERDLGVIQYQTYSQNSTLGGLLRR